MDHATDLAAILGIAIACGTVSFPVAADSETVTFQNAVTIGVGAFVLDPGRVASTTFQLFTSGAFDVFVFKATGSEATIRLYDPSGALAVEKTMTDPTTSISLRDARPGIWTFSMQNTGTGTLSASTLMGCWPDCLWYPLLP